MLTHLLKITVVASMATLSVAMEPLEVNSLFFLTKESIEQTGKELAEWEQNYKNKQSVCQILAAKKLKHQSFCLNFKVQRVNYSENILSLQEKVDTLNQCIDKCGFFLQNLLRREVLNQDNLFLRLYAEEIFHEAETVFGNRYIIYWALTKKVWRIRETMRENMYVLFENGSK